MIVGTAGHIDHGKTTLVRALTGIDTDRLPEEKRRGISIELGYAFVDVPGRDERIGFVDVPGHERLVHTMLAGATGIDHALLLVAADDGVMPQTREHLAVLSLLGLTRATVVLTKVDRVDAERLAAVRSDVEALLADTPLAGAPMLPVSAHTGAGLGPLREMLFEAARATAAHRGNRRENDAAFRLAIDRVFTLEGVGTVVTGTVHGGRVKVGDELAITPSSKALRARVRSLRAQDRVVTQAYAGQRCALALAGIAKDDIARGQWLATPIAAFATTRLDAAMTIWPGEARPLRSGTPVHVHIGSADVMGTVAILQGRGGEGGRHCATDSLAPAARGYVQIVLREPVSAWRGDRVVLRDATASRTLAGGEVLDPLAPARYRRTPHRLTELAAWALPSAGERLAALLCSAEHGLRVDRWAAAEGSATGMALELEDGVLLARDAAEGSWALGPVQVARVQGSLLNALHEFHHRHPEELGPDASRLRRVAAPRLPGPLWRALSAKLADAGAIVARGSFVHLPEHGLRLSATDERLAQKLAPLLASAGFEGAWVRDLARDSREGEALLRTTLARLAQRGELHQVVKDLYYPNDSIARLAARARQVSNASNGEVAAAAFRDATGLGRKRAIQVLEYFDRVGLLRRIGDVHRLRADTSVFVEETT
jgi:selenocysteine-specific elongation factor